MSDNQQDVVGELRRLENERRIAAADRYAELVWHTAGGEGIDVAELDDIMRTLGVDDAQLRRDIQAAERASKLAADLEALPDAEAACNKTSAALAKAEAGVTEAEQRLQAVKREHYSSTSRRGGLYMRQNELTKLQADHPHLFPSTD